MSDGLVEAMWETLVALVVAAAICIGITSLSACLNEVRTARASVAAAAHSGAATVTSSLPGPPSRMSN